MIRSFGRRGISKAQRFVFDHLVKERKSPCFELYSSQVQLITNPTDYYLALHKLAGDAERRICMSSLYLGTGNLEKYLVEKLSKCTQQNPDIRLTMLLDFMRGTRLSKNGESSLTMLKPLRQASFKKKVRVGFFHMPDTGLMKGRFSESPLREIFGVHHIKAHVFDDNVLITGANLSEDYFTDRQDRCMVI